MNPRHLPAIRSQSAPAVLRRPSTPPMAGLDDEESGLDWRRIVSALLRFKWPVLLAVALGLGGGFAATRKLPPVYSAQANAWVVVLARGGEGDAHARGPTQQRAFLVEGALTD